MFFFFNSTSRQTEIYRTTLHLAQETYLLSRTKFSFPEFCCSQIESMIEKVACKNSTYCLFSSTRLNGYQRKPDKNNFHWQVDPIWERRYTLYFFAVVGSCKYQPSIHKPTGFSNMNTSEVTLPGQVRKTLNCALISKSEQKCLAEKKMISFNPFLLYLICYLRSILIQGFIAYSFSQWDASNSPWLSAGNPYKASM